MLLTQGQLGDASLLQRSTRFFSVWWAFFVGLFVFFFFFLLIGRLKNTQSCWTLCDQLNNPVPEEHASISEIWPQVLRVD